MIRPPHAREFAKYPVTAAVCAAAVTATGLSWMGVNVDFMYDGPQIVSGQLWRLVTSTLLHGDVLHLAFNLFWTWTFGTLVERVYGPAGTTGIFLALAIPSSAMEHALYEGGIGLSGVGYGLFGMLWVLSRREGPFLGAIDPRTTAMFAAWFIFCIVTTLTGTMNVANIAHGAGWAWGLALGAGLAINGPGRRATLAGVVLSVAGSVALAVYGRPYVNVSKYAGQDEARLGYEALKEERLADAAFWYGHSVRLNPEDADAWFNLGIVRERSGDTASANEAYARAARLKSGAESYERTAEAADSRRASTSPSGGWRGFFSAVMGSGRR